MSLFVDALSGLLLLAGAAFCLVGALGVLRMPDLFTRIHGAGLSDTLGTGLILLGLALHAGASLAAVKLLAVAALLFLAGPTATHALAAAARARGLEPQLAAEEAPSKR